MAEKVHLLGRVVRLSAGVSRGGGSSVAWGWSVLGSGRLMAMGVGGREGMEMNRGERIRVNLSLRGGNGEISRVIWGPRDRWFLRTLPLGFSCPLENLRCW
jgi:hypothetical protein